LLNKREISSILDAVAQKGLTCILTSIYWKENKIKCDIAIGKGKKNYDQREDVKTRDWNREKQRILKNSNR
jgi:SsrA-binding protein